ncbi:MAG: radical SAM protein [candidate division KSB1 bacterium]|nr:radical SAM protein [candidate division KSB1 bacterium]
MNALLNHAPGITRRGCVDIGHPCDIDCVFCYHRYEDRAQRRFLPEEEIRARLRRFREEFGLEICDFTGGEPTLHPAIVRLTEFAAQIGIPLCIITHGQVRKKELIRALVEAGVAEFLVSIEGPEVIHNRMTNTAEGFQRVCAFLEELDRLGFHNWRMNTVATSINMAALAELAEWAVSLNNPPRNANFIVFSPLRDWAGMSEIDFQAAHSELAPHLKETIDIFSEHGIWTNVRYYPICQLRGYEEHVTTFPQIIFDPLEWDYRAYVNMCESDIRRVYETGIQSVVWAEAPAHVFFNTWSLLQQAKLYVHGPACRNCALRQICDGVSRQYAHRFGFGELQPYRGELIQDPVYWRRECLPYAVHPSIWSGPQTLV